MTGLAAELSSAFGVPVVDGVAAAVKQAEALAALGLATSKHGAYAAPLEKAYRGALVGFSPSRSRRPDNL
jgi:allantoin racemase